ncbi:CCC motif membrane protein [Corallibacter sp.]|uniref:CCC motif membrane protein n=1 Tax=Corallibacter sp. TaxID=2038084 RepID=UPI003A8F2805
MNQNKLPADSSALILGIIAIVLVFLGCCCGVFSVVSVALSIIGLVSANRSLKLFIETPDGFSVQSYNNVKNAKILNIVSLIISSLITVLYIIYFVVYGALISTAFMEAYNNDNTTYQYEYEYSQEAYDSLYNEDYDTYEYQEDAVITSDSISDSLNEHNNIEN